MRFRLFLVQTFLNVFNLMGVLNFWGAAIGALGAIGSGLASGSAAKAGSEAQASASRYSADVQKEIAQRQFEAEQALTPLQMAEQQQMADAYRQSYQTTQEGLGAREAGLQEQFEQAPEELEVLRQQALTGQSEELQQGTQQLQAGLAQAGVRGGQAATQMRRGVGEMTEAASENIQGLMAQEAIGRGQEQRQYDMARQMADQQFLGQSAQYSQQETPEQRAYREAQLKKYEAIGQDKSTSNINENIWNKLGLK